MSPRFPKGLLTFVVPAVLLVCLFAAVLRCHPGPSLSHPGLLYFPCGFFGAAAVIGLLFSQSRVAFIAAFFAFVTVLTDYRFFVDPSPSGHILLVGGTCYAPLVVAALFRLSERGIFNVNGVVRFFILVSSALVVAYLHRLGQVGPAVSSENFFLLSDVSSTVRIPVLGVILLLAVAPLLFLHKEHESPSLGPLLFAATVALFLALNLRSRLLMPGVDRLAFLAFSSAAAVMLIAAVLEGSWRHANLDDLTQLPGRGALKRHMARLRPPYTIAMVDIDHFKRINDRHGHLTGDQALRFIASVLKKSSAGTAYRYGGEEFTVVSEGTDCRSTAERLEELRKLIHHKKFVLRSKTRPRKSTDAASRRSKRTTDTAKSIPITVSIGLAPGKSPELSPHDVLAAADRALYRAKKAGRNRLKTATRVTSSPGKQEFSSRG